MSPAYTNAPTHQSNSVTTTAATAPQSRSRSLRVDGSAVPASVLAAGAQSGGWGPPGGCPAPQRRQRRFAVAPPSSAGRRESKAVLWFRMEAGTPTDWVPPHVFGPCQPGLVAPSLTEPWDL